MAGAALMVASCSGEKEAGRLEYALSQAGPNRVELEKVLDRYSRAPEDSLKYEAAVFLIENMPYYSYYEGEQLDNYLRYYPLLRSTLREKKSPDVAVDSIQKMYGPYSVRSLTRKRDIETVDSTYLCNNIDWAFKVWREQPWGRNVTFEEFKEYILPYRIGDEKLAYWRETYYNYYNLATHAVPLSNGSFVEQTINPDGTYGEAEDTQRRIRVYHHVDSRLTLEDFFAKLKAMENDRHFIS